MSQTHEQLETRIRGMICDRCGQVPTVAWQSTRPFTDGRHVIRCGCGYDKHRLKRRKHWKLEREEGLRAEAAKKRTQAEVDASIEASRSLYE